MRSVTLAALIATALAGPVLAKLPALSDEAKAKAAEAAAKSAWADKVGAYKLCLSMDRVADSYRKQAMASGKASPLPPPAPATASAAASASAPVSASASASASAPAAAAAPIALPSCADPGPYVAAVAQPAKPLEASGAHSPSTMAVGPPSTKATAAEIAPKK